MQIGAIAKASGVSAKMIRHYESIGLIAPGPRRENGYRDYDARDLHELRFIRAGRDLGFSLEDLRALLDLWRDAGRQSGEVKALAARRLAEVEARIRDLQAIAQSLRELVTACHGGMRPDCPILTSLAGEDSAPQKAA